MTDAHRIVPSKANGLRGMVIGNEKVKEFEEAARLFSDVKLHQKLEEFRGKGR